MGQRPPFYKGLGASGVGASGVGCLKGRPVGSHTDPVAMPVVTSPAASPGVAVAPSPPPDRSVGRDPAHRGSRTPRPVARWLGLVVRQLGVIAAFAVPGVVLWWHAWDGHLSSTLTCACGDPGQQVWFIAWPEYALAHGQNPFFSHLVYAPQGANLLSSTSSLFMGTLMIPVTALAGPVAATTVALTLAPALSAWGCWLACRRLTGWGPPAVLAGLLFGYSPFVVDNLALGHVQLTLLVVPPLALLVAYEVTVVQRGSPWKWGLGLGLLLAVQFMISTEVLVMLVLVGAAGAVLWAALSWRTVRAKLPFALRAGAGALLAGAVLTAYPAWYALDGPRHIVGSPWPGIQIYGIWLSDIVNPGPYAGPVNSLTQIGGYEGALGPPLSYLGLGVVLLAVASLIVAYRRRLTWLLFALSGLSVVLASGIVLWWTHSRALSVPWLPWQTLSKLPLLDRVGPQRFMIFADLFAALLIAVGLDALRARLRSGAPGRTPVRRLRAHLATAATVAAALVVLVPIWVTYQIPLQTERVGVPAWFTSAARRVPAGSVVLTYPFALSASGMAQPMVWQAEDGMHFELAGGYLKAPGPGGEPLGEGAPGSAVNTLASLSQQAVGPLPDGTPQQIGNLRQAVERWHVSYVVVTDTARAPLYAASLFTAVIGRAPAVSHDAWVWDLRQQPLRAVSPPLAAAALHACAAPTVGRAPAAEPLPEARQQCVAQHF